MTREPAQPYQIRHAVLPDAPELARLITQLGHPTLPADIEACWDLWCAAGNRALVAALEDGSLVGLATLGQMHVLHRRGPVGRITALVVDRDKRGTGIGRALVAASEQELSRTGCGQLEITSNLRFEDAHAFYQHLGYERTSIRLAKALPAGE